MSNDHATLTPATPDMSFETMACSDGAHRIGIARLNRPGQLNALNLAMCQAMLDQFRASNVQVVFVVDEYGVVQGMVTVRDVLEAIAGEFTTPSDDAWAVRREDGAWLFDGLIPVTELKDRLDLKDLPQEDRGRYNTLAGMIMLLLGRLPDVTDSVEWEGWRFEVVDLDGKRIDKVLASLSPTGDHDR